MRRDRDCVWALIVAGSMLLTGCAALTKGRADLDLGMKELGIASWYGDDFDGWATANGEPYDMHVLTAAHRTLPLGTVARITNVVNGTFVVIRINDRGPYVNGRILDLSYAAAKQLGMLQDGVSAIQLEVVGLDRFEIDVNASGARTVSKLEILERPFDAGSPSTVYIRCKEQTHQGMIRMRPTDVLRERRTRRVGDVMTADRRVEVIAACACV